MRQFLLLFFFHTRFLSRCIGRFGWLLIRWKKLKVHAVGLDRAFYIEGGNVVLEWEVDNAWYIRVSHPGGYYLRSDSTWFTAHPGMPPLRITIRGLGKKVRREFPVLVKPRPGAPSERIFKTGLRTDAIHAGPRLTARAQAITRQKISLNPTSALLPALPEQASGTARDLQAIRRCQDREAFAVLAAGLRQKHNPSPPSENPSTDSHGPE